MPLMHLLLAELLRSVPLLPPVPVARLLAMPVVLLLPPQDVSLGEEVPPDDVPPTHDTDA